MSQYHEALDATIQYLEELKRAGVTHVPVQQSTLDSLTPPAAAPRAPLPTRPAAPATPPAAIKPSSAVPIFTPSTIMATENFKITGSTKTERLASLRQQALVCKKCKHLVASRTQVVFGVGNPESELMFVGEAPGADEDAKGEPFVGRAGQLLTKVIETMGYTRQDIYIANILKCRPNMPAGESGNRQPTPEEMNVCIPWLHAQIDIIQPKVIVALGSVAMKGLMPDMTAGISKLRGHWLLYRNIPLMPTYHPAYVLRQYTLENRRLIWEDMLQALERLGRPITPKMRNYFKKE